MIDKTVKIGIAGLGTVGQGVFSIIREQTELLQARSGTKIEVVAVSARHKDKNRDISFDNITWYDDARHLAQDKEVDVVVELIGGDSGIAYDVCELALHKGKHVVTANKALIAKHGTHFASLAEQHQVVFAYEAAVAGGIPIIKTIKEGLAGNNITKISGIMNGTCNYILTKMQETGQDFAMILAEAQQLGYAEADPTFDVDGIDTAHKLTILSALAFGSPVNFDDVHIEGIRHITIQDIRYAKELGYKIKLLGVCSVSDDGIEQAVYPAMIPETHPIASVDGVNNAVFIESDALGKLTLSGPGAGRLPTASAVIADIVDIATNRRTFTFGKPVSQLVKRTNRCMRNHRCEYYIRLQVEDKAGVLAGITDILGKEDISMEAVIQKPAKGTQAVDIVGITHLTKEQNMMQAIEKLAHIGGVLSYPTMIRIE